MQRRDFVTSMFAAGAWAPLFLRHGAQSKRTFNLLTAGIADIQAVVASGVLSYERIVQLYLNRIQAFDKTGPRLNAVLQVNPRALEIARSLDEERRTKGLRSPLHGVTVAVKDSIDVADMPSASGSLAFEGTRPAYDATVVKKLREAGAIIFLKTNLDEFNFGAQGLSSVGGQVLNPYDLKRNPGGSSAGTGVAVNVAYATVGLGTETGASVRSPASNNSLVGVVPTTGLVGRAGVLMVSYTQDRVGVHAKNVADAASVLTVMRGFEAEDLFTWESLDKVDAKPYTDHLAGASLRGQRIGVLRGLFRRGEQFSGINALIEKEIDLIRQQGAILVDGLNTDMDLIAFFPFARVGMSEFRQALEGYLKRRGPDSPIKNLDDLVASGRYLKDVENSLRNVQRLPAPEQNSEYLARLKNRQMLRELMIGLMDKHRVDVLVYPFKSMPAPPLGTSDRGPRDNPISAITGLPAIVMPAGVNEEGLPFAIEFLGRPYTEHILFRIAVAYESASRRRVAPKLAPNLQGEVVEYQAM